MKLAIGIVSGMLVGAIITYTAFVWYFKDVFK